MIVQHQSNILSKRAIIDLELSKPVTKSTQNLSNDLETQGAAILKLKARKKKLYLPKRYICEDFETKSDYNPSILRATNKSIEYYSHVIESPDLHFKPYYWHGVAGAILSNKFLCLKSGKYFITATLILTLATAADNMATIGSLMIYKNGAAYRTLCTMPLYTAYGVGSNYYFPIMTFHGDTPINISEHEYIEVIFNYNGSLAGTAIGVNLDNIKSYLSITNFL